MHLTTYTDYSLRVLMYLAQKDNHRATIGEIAQNYEISRNHLVKVVYNLGLNGFIRTIRGRRGGITLGRLPEQINLGDVIRHTEKKMAIMKCFTQQQAGCIEPESCLLKQVLEKAQSDFMSHLCQFSLADVVRKQDLSISTTE